MQNRLAEFQNYRTHMNERIAQIDHLGIRRFFNLDGGSIVIPDFRHAVESIDLIRAMRAESARGTGLNQD